MRRRIEIIAFEDERSARARTSVCIGKNVRKVYRLLTGLKNLLNNFEPASEVVPLTPVVALNYNASLTGGRDNRMAEAVFGLLLNEFATAARSGRGGNQPCPS